MYDKIFKWSIQYFHILLLAGDQKDDFKLEAVIDKVRRAAVIDGDGVDGIGGTY